MTTELLIERTLARAPYAKAGETAKIAADLSDGMVLVIEYHTSGKANICDDTREMTAEHWEWEKHGCANNDEWHRYLNRQFWEAYQAGL